MKKFTLIASALLALGSLFAKADVVDKPFYSVPLNSETSFTGHGDTQFTPASGAMTIKNTSGSGGRGYSTVWGTSVFNGVNLPETGYTVSMTFTLNSTGDANKSDFEITMLKSGVTPNASGTYVGSANSLFTLAQIYKPSLEGGVGTGKVACAVNTARGEDATSIAAANIIINTATEYTLRVNKVGTKIIWSILNNGTVIENGSGSYDVAETDTIGALYGCLSRANSEIKITNLSLSYLYDGLVVSNPSLKLYEIAQNVEKDYNATFGQDEILHWILPGETTEADDSGIGYADAVVNGGVEGAGIHTIYCYSNGTLKVWTSHKNDPTVVSEVVEQNVALGWNICPTPTVAITKVSDGVAKTYRVSWDNKSMELTKDVYCYYTITPEGGQPGEKTEILNGKTFEITTKGTVLIETTTGFQEYVAEDGTEIAKYNYSQDASATITNNIEYETALTVEYNKWTTAQVEASGNFQERNTTSGIGADTNGGHWANSFAVENAQYDYDLYNKRSTSLVSAGDYSAVLATSVWCYDVKAENLATAFLPIVPAGDDCSGNGWAFLLDEGIVVDEITTPNSKKYSIESKWWSDDEANKPNLVEIVYTGSYDKYNQQHPYDQADPVSCHHIMFKSTAATDLELYRYDTSINKVVIHTYKGFDPTASISAPVAVDVEDANAPIYTVTGVQVKNATAPGLYIQNGKKFIVK